MLYRDHKLKTSYQNERSLSVLCKVTQIRGMAKYITLRCALIQLNKRNPNCRHYQIKVNLSSVVFLLSSISILVSYNIMDTLNWL